MTIYMRAIHCKCDNLGVDCWLDAIGKPGSGWSWSVGVMVCINVVGACGGGGIATFHGIVWSNFGLSFARVRLTFGSHMPMCQILHGGWLLGL